MDAIALELQSTKSFQQKKVLRTPKKQIFLLLFVPPRLVSLNLLHLLGERIHGALKN